MAVSKRLRFEILRRDNNTCRYCGAGAPETKLVVDHVTPVALGGTDDPANLVAACGPCNSGKTSSAPGAHLIATVTSDQLRWATAMKQVVEDAATKRDEMNAYREAFRREWNIRTCGSDGTILYLPPEWATTMDRFHNAGLPAFMWEEIIAATVAAKRVADPFRYTCGVAWNKVNLLHEAARKTLQAPAGATEATDPRESIFESFAYQSLLINWRWAWGRAGFDLQDDQLNFSLQLHELLRTGAGAKFDLHEIVFTMGSAGVSDFNAVFEDETGTIVAEVLV